MNNIQPQRILYRWNQFLILTQNFILYIGIQLVPSLKWKIQEDITMNRANEQSNLLIASSTNIWQKIIVLNTVFKPRISYLSYAIPFSRLNMCKINKILIKLTKTICTYDPKQHNQNPRWPQWRRLCNQYYIHLIGLHHLNDQVQLGKTYQGLTKYIVIKYGRSPNLPKLTHQACVMSQLPWPSSY